MNNEPGTEEAGYHWPAWCPHGDGYHIAASPQLTAAQQRAEQMGSYGRQQEVQALIHGETAARLRRRARNRGRAGNPS